MNPRKCFIFKLCRDFLLYNCKSQVQQGLKRFGLPKGVNIFLVFLADIVLAFVFMGILMYVVWNTGLLF